MDVAEDIISMGEFTGHMWSRAAVRTSAFNRLKYVIITFEPVYYLFIFSFINVKIHIVLISSSMYYYYYDSYHDYCH